MKRRLTERPVKVHQQPGGLPGGRCKCRCAQSGSSTKRSPARSNEIIIIYWRARFSHKLPTVEMAGSSAASARTQNKRNVARGDRKLGPTPATTSTATATATVNANANGKRNREKSCVRQIDKPPGGWMSSASIAHIAVISKEAFFGPPHLQIQPDKLPVCWCCGFAG